MKIDYLYAAIFVSNIEASESFYSKVLDREPDDKWTHWFTGAASAMLVFNSLRMLPCYFSLRCGKQT